MPTIIGVFFFCFGAYCFLWKEDSLFGLLIIASVFEASSAINVSGRGIQPYYLIAAFIIAKALVNRTLGNRPHKSMPQGYWLLIFGAIGVASAFILPVVFEGIPVYDPKIGIDPGLFIRPPLSFGLNNVGQGGFLAWHIATAYAVLAIDFSPMKARKAYMWAFYIVVLFVFAQSAFQFADIPFPDSLIRNNPGYAILTLQIDGTRNSGTFIEPSLAGGFLVLYCIGFMAEYFAGKGSAAKVLIALVASGAVASSGSLFVLTLFTLILLVRYSPLRFPWYINVRRIRRNAWILFLFIMPLALVLLASSGYRETLMTLTFSKGESGSFINRTAADLYAFQLLPQTYWIGVGLGSNRASSMLATLSSNVGVVGVLAFGMFYSSLFVKLPEEYAWFRWGASALLFNMCISIADVTAPTLWITVLLAVQFTVNQTAVRKKLNGSKLVLRSCRADAVWPQAPV